LNHGGLKKEGSEGGRIIEKILTGVCGGMGGSHMLSSSIRSREGGGTNDKYESEYAERCGGGVTQKR